MADPLASVFGTVDILSFILQYTLSDTKEVPSVALTCRRFNELVNLNPVTSASIWKRICETQSPEIIRIYDLCKESELANKPGGGWKTLLYRSITSCFEPHGMSKQLQRSFELVFSQQGIVAFTNCCGNCTDSYEDCSNSSFTSRKQGITFFKFYLNGMNYFGGDVSNIGVAYTDIDYLHKNWEDECDIIRRWCAVLEVKDYEVEKPKSEKSCIVVRFKQPVTLPDYEFGTDDDSFFDMMDEIEYFERNRYYTSDDDDDDDDDDDSEEEEDDTCSNN